MEEGEVDRYCLSAEDLEVLDVGQTGAWYLQAPRGMNDCLDTNSEASSGFVLRYAHSTVGRS